MSGIIYIPPTPMHKPGSKHPAHPTLIQGITFIMRTHANILMLVLGAAVAQANNDTDLPVSMVPRHLSKQELVAARMIDAVQSFAARFKITEKPSAKRQVQVRDTATMGTAEHPETVTPDLSPEATLLRTVIPPAKRLVRARDAATMGTAEDPDIVTLALSPAAAPLETESPPLETETLPLEIPYKSGTPEEMISTPLEAAYRSTGPLETAAPVQKRAASPGTGPLETEAPPHTLNARDEPPLTATWFTPEGWIDDNYPLIKSFTSKHTTTTTTADSTETPEGVAAAVEVHRAAALGVVAVAGAFFI